MWVLTTDTTLVNIREARKIETVADPDGRTATRVLRAHFGDGDTAVLVRIHQPDDVYATAIMVACLKSLNDALREGRTFCDLTATVSGL